MLANQDCTVNKQLLLTTSAHTYADPQPNIHKGAGQYAHRFDQIQSCQVFLLLAISDMDFLNATECLCSCNTNYQVWLSRLKEKHCRTRRRSAVLGGYKKKMNWLVVKDLSNKEWRTHIHFLMCPVSRSGRGLSNKPYKLNLSSRVRRLLSLTCSILLCIHLGNLWLVF